MTYKDKWQDAVWTITYKWPPRTDKDRHWVIKQEPTVCFSQETHFKDKI